MITEDYCNFEVAKLLKKKGFYQDFLNATIPVWKLNGSREELAFYGDDNYPCEREEWYSAPTHQMAMKWLREKHKIMITIIPQEINVGVDRMCYAIYRITEDLYQPLCNGKVDSFDNSYEEAIEAAIKYSLENLI